MRGFVVTERNVRGLNCEETRIARKKDDEIKPFLTGAKSAVIMHLRLCKIRTLAKQLFRSIALARTDKVELPGTGYSRKFVVE